MVRLPQEPASPTSPAAEVESDSSGLTEIAASHILISYKGALRAAPYIDRSKQEALEFAEELRTQALAGGDFSALAQKNSDDRGSAAQGGSLGHFRAEQMVPEFSSAAFALEVGEFAEVVESQYGFHVIRRDE